MKLTIDTCVINLRRKLDSMNQLEKWAAENKIVIVGTQRLHVEGVKHPLRYRAEERLSEIPNILEPWILGKSALGSCYLCGDDKHNLQFWNLSEIMFPGIDHQDLNDNQSNDVMHLISHYFGKSDIFVTNNTKDFIKNGRREKLKSRYGIIVMKPEEVVSHLKESFGW